MSHTSHLQERAVVVSGATGALGGAVTRRLIEAGARVVLPGRQSERIRERFAQAVGEGKAVPVEADLSNPDAADLVRDRTLEALGGIDALINVAGGFAGGAPVHETPLEIWDRMFEMNLRTALSLSRAMIVPMLERGAGCIVNVGSVAALSGGANMAAYSASKAALLRLTESLSEELRPHGIRVNIVLPGILDTEVNRRAMPDADRGDWISLDAVADTIVFLVSDAARALQGVAIPLRGAASASS